MGDDIVSESLESETIFNDDIVENISTQTDLQVEKRFLTGKLTSEDLVAGSYLIKAESCLSKKLVSEKNFKDIIKVANYFPSNLTSFLGFECHLGVEQPKADWAFAISGVGKDKEIFTTMFKNNYLLKKFLKHPEWKQISKFAETWADPKSVLNDKVQCFWLEFDMPESSQGAPIPCVFFGPTKQAGSLPLTELSQYEWLTKTALPLLKGKEITKNVEKTIKDCLEKMPKNTTLFQIGTMLSRDSNSVRIHINKIKPEQIIPYLTEIGWKGNTEEFENLIYDLKDKADRFVISYDVTDLGIAPRIGIELSFTSNLFHNEDWSCLFDYMVKKGICFPRKKEALMEYVGTSDDEYFSGGIMKPVTSSANILETIESAKIVRYINHVKIVYQPGKPLEAKAYPAVRLFE